MHRPILEFGFSVEIYSLLIDYIPPFYSRDFFNTIRTVHEKSPKNIAIMTEKEWTKVLIEMNVTMEQVEEEQWRLIRCRVEQASPQINWERTWRLLALSGLGSEHRSFLFKMSHQLLPTQERINRTSKAASPTCKAQGCTGDQEEDLIHALVDCKTNNGVGLSLLNALKQHMPQLSSASLLRLEFDTTEEMELPVTWISAAILMKIWEMRISSNMVKPFMIRAKLEAKINLMRETRHSNISNSLINLLNSIL